MKVFLALSVLSALFFASNCRPETVSATPVQNQSRPNGPTCEALLYQGCVNPIIFAHHQAVFQSTEAAAAVLSDRARLEVLAMDFQRAVHCIDGELAKPVCNGFNLLNSGLDILIFIAGYLENPAHLDILTAVSSSPCLHNETAQRLTGMSAHMCLMAFMGEPPLQQDICLGLKTLERCSVHAVASGCDLASASFLQSIWDYAAEPAVQLHLLGLSDLSPIAGDCHQHD